MRNCCSMMWSPGMLLLEGEDTAAPAEGPAERRSKPALGYACHIDVHVVFILVEQYMRGTLIPHEQRSE